MKTKFVMPKAEVIVFDTEDVITTSAFEGEIDTLKPVEEDDE